MAICPNCGNRLLVQRTESGFKCLNCWHTWEGGADEEPDIPTAPGSASDLRQLLVDVLRIMSSGERLSRQDRLQALVEQRGPFVVGRMLRHALGDGWQERFDVKGRLVTAGKVAVSPWVWIYARSRPFYSLAYLFAADGHAAFLSLGVDNEGTPWEDNVARLRAHADRIRNAVALPAGAETAIDDLSGAGNARRARANAAGNAFAYRYERDAIPDPETLWLGLYRMLDLFKAVGATGLLLER